MKNTSYRENRPKLSKSQIEENKNFNSTLKSVNIGTHSYFKFFISGGLATLIIIVSLYYFKKSPESVKEEVKQDFTYMHNDNDLRDQISAIQPPFADFDIKYEVFKIDIGKDNYLTSESGSRFFIPKECMTDSSGKKVKGIVEIHYREFRDVVDFFLSGIPMTYDSLETTYVFESAGMLEIKGFQKERPLNLIENTTIDFEFNSTTNTNGFNFYSLNETTGEWQNENVSIPAIKRANEYPFEEKEDLFVEDEKTYISEPIAPVKRDEDKFSLSINVDKERFPELSTYEGTLFEVDDSIEKFDPVIYNVQWENAFLKNAEQEGKYILELSREDSSVKLIVYPVVKNELYKQAMIDYRKKMDIYETSIQENRDNYNEFEESELAASIGSQVITETMRVFSIADFGIYNCDKPRMFPNLLARKSIIDDDENKITSIPYYVANTRKNSMAPLSYDKKNMGIRYYKKGTNIVWFVDKYGWISIMDPEQFNHLEEIDHLKFARFSPEQGIAELRDLLAS